MSAPASGGAGCPKCGGTSGWVTNDRVYGWETWIGDWGGSWTEIASYDQKRHVLSKTVECQDCGARVPRPGGWRHAHGTGEAPE